jgi:general secretion pathway protein G
LVVVLIIGVLVSLISAAAVKGISFANRTRNMSEIRQLNNDVEAFKSKYGVYPPSRIKLSETCNYPDRGVPGSLDAISVAYLQRIWPRINLTAGNFIDWNGNRNQDPPTSPTPATIPDGDVILEGDQCLVFFLSGIPDNFSQIPSSGWVMGQLYPTPNAPAGTGFSTNPVNPAAHIVASGVTPGPVVNPFHEFTASRLYKRNPGFQYTVTYTSSGTTASFPSSFTPNPIPPVAFYSYRDTYNLQPYAYFSSGTTRNGYPLLQNVLVVGGNPTSDCQNLAVWPYAQNFSPAAQYQNPNNCQIISAGADGQFGPGSITTGATWTSATAGTLYPAGSPGYDDQSNFHDSTLGATTY